MSQFIKPCHCGYAGAILGIDHGTHLTVECPECHRSAEAFTVQELVHEWNKEQPQQQAEVKP